jgi:outer membrane protein TolC
MMDLRLKQLQRQQEGMNDLARPQLFLNAQFSVKGGHENLGDAFTMDKPDKGLFLSFNYPLGNRKAVAERNKSRLQVRQLSLQQDEIALDLEAGVRNLAIQLQELEKVLALNERQIASAREKTAAELQRYNQGRGDLAFVIQSQDNVQAARLAYAQNAALYHRLNLQLDALMDELLTAEAGP